MTFWDDLQNFFVETEADVQKVIVAAKNDVAMAEAQILSAVNWVAGNAGNIAADIQAVESLIVALGANQVPAVATAIQEANVAVAALNAFAKDINSGASMVQALKDGYSAFKAAQAAVASATSAAVKS